MSTVDGTLTASILLVDDRPANLLALEAILRPLEQRLVVAYSGEEALKRLLQEDFALILMDVEMPDLDGLRTATLIRQRERSRSTPIIFLTAIHGERRAVFQGYQAGAVDYLVKPIEPELLRAKVGAFVGFSLQERQRVAREAAEKANRSKDEFLAMVTHELRSPLNAIVGWTEMHRRR